jgi:hypothetical protein
MDALQRIKSGIGKGPTAIHLLVITLLGLPMITPLLKWSSVPCTHDGHLHFHRIAAIRHAWESGLPLSRWLPDLAFGYGYPFFVFREAPPLYLTLIPNLLGFPLSAALNLFYIVSILAAGWFMYLWVRDVFGPRAGIISAVAYMASPYILMDALVRGNQPESLALALLPLICWAGRRFIIRGSTVPFLIATFGLTLLALSHNISIFLFAPFLLVYLVSVGWMNKSGLKPVAFRILIMFGLGLGMAAFYLGPALLELDEITISHSVSSRNNNFRFNFSSLAEILSPVQAADSALLNPPLLIRLGWVSVLLGLLGIISLIWARTRERRGHIVFMTIWVVAYLVMALSASLFVWENIPLIEFVQFPWRFIGRAALPVAFLAGVPFAYLYRRIYAFRRNIPLAQIVTTIAAVLLVVETIPNLYPHECIQETQPSINTVHNYERDTGMVGVDPEGSYFPKSVQVIPTGSALEDDYLADRQPQRYDRSAFPGGAVVSSFAYTPLSGRLTLNSPTAFQARYLSFAYPGWVAIVDANQVPITPSDPEGLITFPVPAGQHTIEVRWRATPVRAALNGVSIAALITLVITAIVLFIRQGQGSGPPSPEIQEQAAQSEEDGQSEPTTSAISFSKGITSQQNKQPAMLLVVLLIIAGISLLLIKVLVIDSVDNPFRHTAQLDTDYPFDIIAGELQFEGYDLSRVRVEGGQTFDIDLAWQVLEPPASDYQSNIWLVDSEGVTWSDKETARPRIYEDTAPTTFWQPGQWAWDSREVAVLSGTPPGLYEIALILFDRDTLQPLTLTDRQGTVVGPMALIGNIEVVAPESGHEIAPQFELNEPIGGLTLIGYNQDRIEATPGEPLLLTLLWEKELGDLPLYDELSLVLLDESGMPLQSWTIPPVKADFPPTQWPADIIFRGQHALRLEPELEAGIHELALNEITLGQLRIGDLERLFEEPKYDLEVRANFGDLAELAGVTVEATESGPITVSLVWKALAEIPTTYRVFVHLVDEEGALLVQSDAEPANWTRPTTGWLSGEYIVGTHKLSPPTGEFDGPFALRIGLYDPVTQQRLTTSTGDFLQLELGQINR